jgi:hypothetical protein
MMAELTLSAVLPGHPTAVHNSFYDDRPSANPLSGYRRERSELCGLARLRLVHRTGIYCFKSRSGPARQIPQSPVGVVMAMLAVMFTVYFIVSTS